MTEATNNLKKGVSTIAAALLLVAGSRDFARAQSQSHWVIDPNTSLAWWQMNPNYGHLWATTCPGDPSWHAGEGTSGFSNGGEIQKTTKSAHMDYRIPLYPRKAITPVCRKAVVGQVEVTDTKTLKGIRGSVFVNSDSLETGSHMRDAFAHKLFSGQPQVRFMLDSITSATIAPGDTIRGTALGNVEIHGVVKPLMVVFTAFPDAGGMRVQGKWQMHPRQLIETFKMSKFALGAGVGMDLWKELHMGFDLLFKQAPSSGTPGSP
jgi:hypothetical protein